ncbi:MAG: catalase family protein [Pseudomonadota bacterium]
MKRQLSAALSALMSLSASIAFAADMQANKASTPYPVADAFLGERLYPNEQAIAQEMASIIEATIRKQYQPGGARRDAHPKAHGCVKAEFKVDDKLADRFAKGVFIPGKTYQAWIRFSNGNPDPNKPDIEGNERGMSIKLLSIPGEKILASERQDTTQDFIMMSNPAFFLKDPSNAVAFFSALGSDSTLAKAKIPFILGPHETATLLKINSKKISNPLQTRYWSPVPYQLGVGPNRLAIKFSARSCSTNEDSFPENPGPNFLRDAMSNTLKKGDACMEFLIQPKASEKLSVEDALNEWEESDAPFYKVATIRIPQQVFDTPEQQKFCENLSYTPWHALPEHKPLGGINRLRKVVYERISTVRHEMNQTERKEP